MDAAAGNSEARYIPIHVESLDYRALQMDLYIQHDRLRPPALYRAAGVPFSKQDAERLAQQKVTFLYISAHQHAVYRRSLIEKLERTYTDPDLAAQERARLVRASCTRMIEDVLLLPGQAEAVESVAEISRSFSDWSAQDGKGFGYLLDMSAHDFYTATHMMNVGVGCGLLMKALEPEAKDLFAVTVQGGLLHDVGKRKIPSNILNKEGKLEGREWEMVKAHPELGYEELRQQPAVPDIVLAMARDHHERMDGAGYPNGKRGDEISLPARICAVVDVFDAITAARPYRGPTPPMETLRIMSEGVGRQFDARVFRAWEDLVKRMIEEDPQRATASTGKTVSITLDSCIPVGGVSVGTSVAATPTEDIHARLWADNRRRFERKNCRVPAKAMFIRQGKPSGIDNGVRFDAVVLDISRGGLRIETPWPVTLNDVLIIEFPGSKPDEPIVRQGRVVRAGHRVGAMWRSGISFLSGAERQAA